MTAKLTYPMDIICKDCGGIFLSTHHAIKRCHSCQQITKRKAVMRNYYRGRNIPITEDEISVKPVNNEEYALCHVLYDPDEDYPIRGHLPFLEIEEGCKQKIFADGFIYKRDNRTYLIENNKPIKISANEAGEIVETLKDSFLLRKKIKAEKND